MSNKPKKFIDILVAKKIIEKEPLVLKKSFGIVSDYHKDVSTLIINNHLTLKLKNLIDDLAK